MSDKVLLPDPNDWKRARLIERGDSYVVQTRYNSCAGKHEQEDFIPKSEENATIIAVVKYCDLLCDAFLRILHNRKEYRLFIQKIKESDNCQTFIEKIKEQEEEQ